MTVRVAVPGLLAASLAVTVITLDPLWRAIPATDQFAVPVAVPLPPRLLDQLTCVTPTLSEAVPLTLSVLLPVAYVALEVGNVIVMVGEVVSGGGPSTVTLPSDPEREVALLRDPMQTNRQSSPV